MPKSSRLRPALAGALTCVAICAAAAPPATATPITVNLRVEGSTTTLFEGPITTDAESISTPSSPTPHPCDVADNGSNGGFGPMSATPTTAVFDAAKANGLAFDATWSNSYNDFFITKVGSDANGGPPTYPSWGYAVNFTTAGVGGCQFQLAPGSNVLWAYDYFNKLHLLYLTGPSSASVGQPVTVKVVDGQNGQPIAAATVGGSTTGADGTANVTFSSTGNQSLKASRSDSVRSNALVVCVHNGNDGTCGTSAPAAPGGGGGGTSGGGSGGAGTAPVTHEQTPYRGPFAVVAEALGVLDGHRYARGRGPRVLGGKVSSQSPITSVSVSLRRLHHGHCQAYGARSERFMGVPCGTEWFFGVGSGPTFSYLLPQALPLGRYTYDVAATDAAGNRVAPARGTSRVVFYVG